MQSSSSNASGPPSAAPNAANVAPTSAPLPPPPRFHTVMGEWFTRHRVDVANAGGGDLAPPGGAILQMPGGPPSDASAPSRGPAAPKSFPPMRGASAPTTVAPVVAVGRSRRLPSSGALLSVHSRMPPSSTLEEGKTISSASHRPLFAGLRPLIAPVQPTPFVQAASTLAIQDRAVPRPASPPIRYGLVAQHDSQTGERVLNRNQDPGVGLGKGKVPAYTGDLLSPPVYLPECALQGSVEQVVADKYLGVWRVAYIDQEGRELLEVHVNGTTAHDTYTRGVSESNVDEKSSRSSNAPVEHGNEVSGVGEKPRRESGSVAHSSDGCTSSRPQTAYELYRLIRSSIEADAVQRELLVHQILYYDPVCASFALFSSSTAKRCTTFVFRVVVENLVFVRLKEENEQRAAVREGHVRRAKMYMNGEVSWDSLCVEEKEEVGFMQREIEALLKKAQEKQAEREMEEDEERLRLIDLLEEGDLKQEEGQHLIDYEAEMKRKYFPEMDEEAEKERQRLRLQAIQKLGGLPRLFMKNASFNTTPSPGDGQQVDGVPQVGGLQLEAAVARELMVAEKAARSRISLEESQHALIDHARWVCYTEVMQRQASNAAAFEAELKRMRMVQERQRQLIEEIRAHVQSMPRAKNPPEKSRLPILKHQFSNSLEMADSEEVMGVCRDKRRESFSALSLSNHTTGQIQRYSNAVRPPKSSDGYGMFLERVPSASVYVNCTASCGNLAGVSFTERSLPTMLSTSYNPTTYSSREGGGAPAGQSVDAPTVASCKKCPSEGSTGSQNLTLTHASKSLDLQTVEEAGKEFYDVISVNLAVRGVGDIPDLYFPIEQAAIADVASKFNLEPTQVFVISHWIDNENNVLLQLALEVDGEMVTEEELQRGIDECNFEVLTRVVNAASPFQNSSDEQFA